eukprot:3385462-Rhodomonas_salina.2
MIPHQSTTPSSVRARGPGKRRAVKEHGTERSLGAPLDTVQCWTSRTCSHESTTPPARVAGPREGRTRGEDQHADRDSAPADLPARCDTTPRSPNLPSHVHINTALRPIPSPRLASPRLASPRQRPFVPSLSVPACVQRTPPLPLLLSAVIPMLSSSFTQAT